MGTINLPAAVYLWSCCPKATDGSWSWKEAFRPLLCRYVGEDDSFGRLIREVTLYDSAPDSVKTEIDAHIASYYVSRDSLYDSLDSARYQILSEGPVVSGVVSSAQFGFAPGSEFVLEDGTVWRQTSFETIFELIQGRRALIYPSFDGTKMHIEGVSRSVTVRRSR